MLTSNWQAMKQALSTVGTWLSWEGETREVITITGKRMTVAQWRRMAQR